MKRNQVWPRWLLWGLCIPLIALNGWVAIQIFSLFGSLVSVLVTATLLSFLLDYPVRFLQRLRVGRVIAVFLVLLITITVLVLLAATLLPTLIEQMNDLVTRIPDWITSSSEQFEIFQNWAIAKKLPVNTSKWAAQLDERLVSQLQDWSGQILNFTLDILGRFADVLLTFVMTFYLLLHGHQLWDGIFHQLPRKQSHLIRGLLRTTFHNYFVGLLTLGSIIGISMTIAFSILNVPFGLLFGLVIGAMALFPFGIALSICVISLLVALQDVWLGIRLFLTAALIDATIENAIFPKLMGDLTGLNPILVILALLVGLKVGGLLGLVLAVPLTSFVKSWLEQTRSQRLQSLYVGSDLDTDFGSDPPTNHDNN